MNDFVYHIPTKVYFGKEQLCHLGDELKKLGTRGLLVYGGGSIKRAGLYDKVISVTQKAGIELCELSGVQPNPRVNSVRDGAEICKREKLDFVLAVGSGSVIDCAKYIAAAACVDFDAWKFQDPKGRLPVTKALPIVAVSTAAATGSEMDCGGVIMNPETNEKIGGGSPDHLFPTVSFMDPTNTFTVSAYQTACGAFDMLSHVMEVYFNTAPELFMIEKFMEGLMKSVIKYAPIALNEPENYEARANLMWTAAWSMNGFIYGTRRQAWTCHPVEHELSAFYDIPHGHGLAILFPRWLEYCLNESNSFVYYKFGVNVFDIDPELDQMTVAKKSIGELKKFAFSILGLKPSLSDIGIDDKNFAIMAEKACPGGVIPGFVPMSATDIENIYKMCL